MNRNDFHLTIVIVFLLAFLLGLIASANADDTIWTVQTASWVQAFASVAAILFAGILSSRIAKREQLERMREARKRELHAAYFVKSPLKLLQENSRSLEGKLNSQEQEYLANTATSLPQKVQVPPQLDIPYQLEVSSTLEALPTRIWIPLSEAIEATHEYRKQRDEIAGTMAAGQLDYVPFQELRP